MKKTRILSALTLVVLILTLMLSSCSAEQRLAGTWVGQSKVLGIVTEYEYVFNEDGTGSLPGVLGITIPMTYTVEANTIIVKNSVVEAAEDVIGTDLSTTYTFELGIDTLKLTDKNGKVIELTRKK